MTDVAVLVKELRNRGEECESGQDVSSFDTGNLLLMAAYALSKLSEQRDMHSEQRDQATAEAAALREALVWYREFENYVCRNDVEFNYFVVADGGERAREALSRPGPGAALFERLQKAEQERDKLARQKADLEYATSVERDELRAKLKDAKATINAKIAEKNVLWHERNEARDELDRLAEQVETLTRERDQFDEWNRVSRALLKNAEARVEELTRELAEVKESGSARQRIRFCQRAEKAEQRAAKLREAATELSSVVMMVCLDEASHDQLKAADIRLRQALAEDDTQAKQQGGPSIRLCERAEKAEQRVAKLREVVERDLNTVSTIRWHRYDIEDSPTCVPHEAWLEWIHGTRRAVYDALAEDDKHG